MNGVQRLSGRSALVTGAGRGLGNAIATRLGSEGAFVGVNDVDPDCAQAAVAAILEQGGKAIALPGDVADEADVASMVAAIVKAAGGLDVLVNNAGIFPWRDDWTDIPAEEWDRVMAVNVHGAYLCARAAHPHLKASEAGRIVNLTSTTWLSGPRYLLHYVTSKAALVGLTRALASELGDDRITVNAVATGRTLTEGVQEWIEEGHMAMDEIHVSRQSQPIKRLGESWEVAAAVAFLASDDAAYITGQVIIVDGGRNKH